MTHKYRKNRLRRRGHNRWVHITAGHPDQYPAPMFDRHDAELAEQERLKAVLADQLEELRDEHARLVYEVLYTPARAFAHAWHTQELVDRFNAR